MIYTFFKQARLYICCTGGRNPVNFDKLFTSVSQARLHATRDAAIGNTFGNWFRQRQNISETPWSKNLGHH